MTPALYAIEIPNADDGKQGKHNAVASCMMQVAQVEICYHQVLIRTRLSYTYSMSKRFFRNEFRA